MRNSRASRYIRSTGGGRSKLPTVTEQLRIDIYARESQKGDKDQRSTGGQIEVCRAVLADRDLPEGEVFKDEGTSAWREGVTRPGWDALMARLESGQSGGVIVFDLERFARRIDDGQRLVKASKRGLMVLDSDAEFDLTTASGEKSFNDAMSAAVYYSHRLSDRVKRGKLRKARNGQVDNGGQRPFGFLDDALTVREDEARWITWLAKHLLHGDAQDALVRHLNSRGLTTTAGKPWTQRALRDVMLRERNRGNIEHCGTVVARLPGEPILSDATYGRIVALYAARSRGRPPSPKYTCSGVAFCALCGKRLSGRPRGDRCYEDGQVKREYWCSPSANSGCAKISIDQRALDAVAKELTVLVLSDPRQAGEIEAIAADRAEAVRDLDALIAKDESLALEIGGRLGRGEMTLARHDAIMGPVDKRLGELRARRAELGDQDQEVPEVTGSCGSWVRRWDDGTPEERRQMLRLALRGQVIRVGPADPEDRTNALVRLSLT
jgi:site-specific DNA recombinase